MRRIFTLSIALLFFTLFAKAQDQVTNTAGTSTTVAGVATKAWDVPPIPSLIWQNVQKPNDAVANITLINGQKSDFLVLSNFNFNIPLNYAISQIIVSVYGNSTVPNSISIPYLQLINTSPITAYTPIVGSFSKAGFVRFETFPISSTQQYGSSCSQLCYWNTNLKPADVNNPTFGLVVQFLNSDGTTSVADIDYITITLVLAQEGTLPVNFISFTGNKSSLGTQLNWKVSEEKSVKFYDVEKSTNGNSFNTIGMVRATGESNYSFTDVQPSPDLVFYRIKNVDMDERYKYSTVLSFRNGSSALVFKVFPTLVHNSFTIQHATIKSGAKINISAADGRLIKSIVPSSGSIQTQVDLGGQTAGIYIVRFENGEGQVETVKVVKQ